MSFKKNPNLENILRQINRLLEPVEKEQIRLKGNDFSMPSILQIGSPRSGTTFFTQWMASHGLFSNPTNFLSRFYGAPYVGALIYEMLINPKYDYRNEFFDIANTVEFKSEIGKTKGFNAPHEFWYFWRKNFNFPDVPASNDVFLKGADFNSFNKELSLIQRAFDKPFIIKAHIVNWYLRSVADHMRNAIYIHIFRNPVANVRSLMRARKNWSGDINKWFSWKPREYELIKEMDVYHQVAGQIYFIEKTIIEDRKYLGNRYLMFSYEELCNNPEKVYYKVLDKVNQFSKSKIEKPYKGKKRFTISNSQSEFDDKKIKRAFQYFVDNYGELRF
ncbi:MAG: sulfotransferase [Candidatus Moranbacteria bacterium]|nr:sulfotransferase [Candidatus Moranbacteria bacterium]